MEIDRQALIKLLEAFVDVSEVLQRELMLHQMLFSAACKTKGLTDEQIQKAVERGRETGAKKIIATCRADHQSLVAKLPQLVDLLSSDQDAALRSLKEWTPKGPIN